MIGQVQTKDGQKIVQPISGSIPTGNPVGSLLITYKKLRPRNYFYCDGRDTTGTPEELRLYFPALYLYLGTNVLPDYRECTMVGAEENTTDQIETHDVYAQGEFKDDQIQNITGSTNKWRPFAGNGTNIGAFENGITKARAAEYQSSGDYISEVTFDASRVARAGTTTHSKQKAVYVYIKAVDGVDISDEDTFLVTVKNFVDERVTRAESYSTEEQWTGGYWIDGKKIYRRVVSCGALPNNTPKTVAHNIANIEWIVKYNGVASDGNEWLQLPASYYSNSAIGLSVNDTNINLRPYTNRTTYTTTLVTIEYTKTTD